MDAFYILKAKGVRYDEENETGCAHRSFGQFMIIGGTESISGYSKVTITKDQALVEEKCR